MSLPDVNFETRETILDSIDKVADSLAKKMILKINDAYYRIIDFEFYVHTESGVLQDKHTYKGKLQQTRNRLYVHYSGVDITFGDGTSYGGILIRGVVKLTKEDTGYKKEKFQGPQVVLMELFSNLRSLDSDQKNEIILSEAGKYIPAADFPEPLKLIKTKRKNLSAAVDKAEFQDEPLRYIALFHYKEDFNYKVVNLEKILLEQYKAGFLNAINPGDILGYDSKSFVNFSIS